MFRTDLLIHLAEVYGFADTGEDIVSRIRKGVNEKWPIVNEQLDTGIIDANAVEGVLVLTILDLVIGAEAAGKKGVYVRFHIDMTVLRHCLGRLSDDQYSQLNPYTLSALVLVEFYPTPRAVKSNVDKILQELTELEA